LPRQFVGDLIENAAVGIKTPGRRIKIGMCLLFQINQRAAFDAWALNIPVSRAKLSARK